jgi:hypothetical protein
MHKFADIEARAQDIGADMRAAAEGRGVCGGPQAAPGRTRPWIPPIRRATPCGAHNREGGPCRAPSVRGSARCRMHGGAAALIKTGERMLGELAEGAG